MKKLTISILSLIAIAMLVGIAFADPWETFRNVATSRNSIVIGPGFDFTTSAAGTCTLTNGATIPAGGTLAGTVTGDVTGDVTGNLTGDVTGDVTGNVTASGTVQAEQLTSTDDARIADDLTVNDLTINETLNIDGAADFDGETDFSSNVTLRNAPILYPYESAQTHVLSDSNIPYMNFVGNSSANQTIYLPDASVHDGMILKFVVVTEPGTYNVVIEGDDADTINGAANKTSSALYDALEVVAINGNWAITSHEGTWT